MKAQFNGDKIEEFLFLDQMLQNAKITLQHLIANYAQCDKVISDIEAMMATITPTTE